MQPQSEFPYTLFYRDRYNCEQSIRVSKAERDSLGNAIEQQLTSRKKYNLVGTGTEFYRAENGLLMSLEFTAVSARKPSVIRTAIDQLREWGLHWEAAKLSMRLNCTAMLERAPVNSGTHYKPTVMPVLFAHNGHQS